MDSDARGGRTAIARFCAPVLPLSPGLRDTVNGQMLLQSWSRLVSNPLAVKPASPSCVPALIRPRNALLIASVVRNGTPASVLKLQESKPITVRQSSVSYPTAIYVGFGPTPELGLLSLLFVLSTAFGAIFSLAIISIPTMSAFRRLAASMDKLVKVASEEVPGTFSSLKLSGLEINDLTQQLGNLRQKISGNQYGKKDRGPKSTSFGRN